MAKATGSVVVLLLLLSLSWGGVHALYSKNSPVVELTGANFNGEVIDSPHVWVVEFYAPWCGHCQRFAPEYEKAATNLKGLVKVGAIDCDAEKNKPVCGAFEIKGFPTIKVFPSETTSTSKGVTKTPIDYNQDRAARAVVDFALNLLPMYVKKVSSKPTSKKAINIDDFIAEQADKLSRAILFTSKTETTPLFKALAVEFKDALILGEAQSTDASLVAKYAITKFPTLIVLPKDKVDEPVVYTGALKQEALFEFLEPFAVKMERKKPSGSSPKKEEPKEDPFDPEVTFVSTQAQLEKECLKKPYGTCVVTFLDFDPEWDRSVKEHQQNLQILRNLKKKAHDSKAGFHFLWVDASDQEALRNSFGVSDILPAVFAMSPSKNVFRPFVGGFDEPSLAEFLADYQSGRNGRFFKYNHEPKIKETAGA